MGCKNKLIFLLIVFFLAFSVALGSSACWEHSNSASCTADTNNNCNWKTDNWGSWCEEMNCWNYWNQTACGAANIPGKTCNWKAGGVNYGCEKVNCWGFSGTNQSTCESNSKGLSCEWNARCYTSGTTDGTSMIGVSCWNIANESQCSTTTGCKWGECYSKGCWSYTNSSACAVAKDWEGRNCTWDTGSNYCVENRCWRYYNESWCNNNAITKLNCEWKWNSCQEKDCYSFDYTNETACVNNTLNLSCSWGGSWCNKQDCWNYNTQSGCEAKSECKWTAWYYSGWCEELNCWSYDSWNGGNQTTCESALSGICSWTGNPAGNTTNGWCFKDFSNTNCANMTTEKACMDTFYCWWQYNNWNNVSAGGTCNEPGSFGFIESNETIFDKWNPGCYIFDVDSCNQFNNNQSGCIGSALGCYYLNLSVDNSTGFCNSTIRDCDKIIGCNWTGTNCSAINENSSIVNVTANYISTNGINCSFINDSQMCNQMPMLSSCCSWQNGSCSENKFTTSCWDQMQQPPEGASFCEDYNSYSNQQNCIKIAGFPWYMPCSWNSSSGKCGFKSSDVFGDGSQSLVKIDNKKSCEAAGGKWIVENYCEGNVSVPSGRCEYKFDEEDNCDKACFACELKGSGGVVINSSNAETECEESELGICEFALDTNAPNEIGYCKAKEQFKKGIVGDCDLNCGDCSFKGDALSNDTTKKPSYFCANSKANSEGGGCKWIVDNSTNGGYCIKKGEKTCEDSCDRCATQTACQNLGRTSGNLSAGSCKWDGDASSGSCVTHIDGDVEICWDAVDNDNDNLIDCADSYCYSDSFCGFVSGDCFGWITNTTCIANGCEWVTDKWGSWCDFNGSQCWRYNVNEANCSSHSTCRWKNDSYSSGWCENDWTKSEKCMGLNRTFCTNATMVALGCNWTVDSWCLGSGNQTDWCQNNGGWCDYEAFKPKNCWMATNSSSCSAVSGCSWYVDQYSQPHCEVDWSVNCWQYYDNSSCSAANCLWRSDQWSSWCTNKMDECWSAWNQTSCNALSSKCQWDGTYCQPKCFNSTLSTSSSQCNAVSGCIWKEENGWCQESASCWNFNNQSTCTNATGVNAGCRWKESGWCDPIQGFSTTSTTSSGGAGTNVGADCWKYDGNQSACTNKTLIGISCSWMTNSNPTCEVNWGGDCWQYNSTAGGCNSTNNCWYNPGYWGGSGWCANIMDQCWSNISYQSWNNTDGWLGNCTSNHLCTNNSWGSCEPICFSLNSTSCTNNTFTGKCKYPNGWCNPSLMGEMFTGMESGALVPLAIDTCPDSGVQASADLCGFGMKDMGDSYGFGANVLNFENASACNKEKLSSFVMGMFENLGSGASVGSFAGGGGINEKIGTGNETVKFFVYLDTDGNTTGGCVLDHDSSINGYEFRLKYVVSYNITSDKISETFNVYKCDDGTWKATDIKLSAWRQKMCSEIGGPMLAVKKDDLAKYPELYDSTKDMRVFVTTAGNTGNISSPLDIAGPGWATPGSIDFDIASAFEYGADSAKFEDILKNGFVKGEDCFASGDEDGDGLSGCADYDCQFSVKCTTYNYSNDTSTPQVIGVKIEEYPDSALILYDTNKPTNGTLLFYKNDSQCLTLNASIYDSTILTNTRDFLTWHDGEIYSANLGYNLNAGTTYYYKLKVCDSGNRCALSKCSSFITAASSSACGYCNFVTRIKTPSNWKALYDLNSDGTYEHTQGEVCGPNAGMKTNYSSGRLANVKLQKSDASVYIEFLNVTLTKTGLNDKVRTISSAGDVISDSNKVGLTSETRDKIINNLHPQACRIKIPKASDGSCSVLYHFDDNGENCVDRTSAAGGAPIDAVNCVWNVPYCEFSTYKTTSSGGGTTTTSSGGGGGGGGGAATIAVSQSQLISGLSKFLSVGDKFRLLYGVSDYHYVKLIELTENSVKINVTSEPQIATLKIGDSRRFDVTGDGFYDFKIILNSINFISGKSNLTIVYNNEEVTEESEAVEGSLEEGAIPVHSQSRKYKPEEQSAENKINFKEIAGEWWKIIVLIVVLFLIALLLVEYRKNKEKETRKKKEKAEKE